MSPADFFAHRRTASTPAGDIAYVDRGPADAPAALFVHGVFLNSYLWSGVVDGVEDVRRCIAVDLPCHGATPASDHDLSLPGHAATLVSLLDALGIEQADLVGNDSGGGICQAVGAHHPERVRTMALTNCDVHTDLPPESFAPIVELAHAGALADVVTPVLSDLSAARGAGALGDGFEDPDAIPDEEILAYVDAITARPDIVSEIQRFLVEMRVEDLMALEPGLKGLDAPTLLVWGTGDIFFDVKWARWLRDTVPGARDVIEIPGARLFFPHERPDDLVPHLRDLWRS